MKAKIRLAIMLTLFCVSCSSIMNSIQNNVSFTENLISSVFKQNGNVFYLNTTSAPISTVWTYNGGKLEVYKVSKSKIVFQKEYTKNGFIDIMQISKSDLAELDQCLELDGDNFGYWIKVNSEIVKYNYPIGINCFTKLNYKSSGLNGIVQDIKTHKLWDVFDQ